MLTQLKARGFRNLEPLTWDPPRGLHLILGGNGAGKTSLLEAIYVLTTTRSFRAGQLADCARHGEAALRLEGEVEVEARWRLELGWSRQGGLERAVNGNATTLAEHLAVLPVVTWTAELGELLTGPPGLRRRFLDRGLIGLRSSSLKVVGRYRRALNQKRELLQRGGRGLEAWNELLAEAAAELITLRRAYAERLDRALGEVLARCMPNLPEVRAVYRPSPAAGLEGRQALARELARAAGDERRQKMPLLGPHRDDLRLRWAGRALRRVASAGELKSVGLALVAAQGKVLERAGHSPLYLLDDADAELAADTLERVWKAFTAGHQVLATSNRPEVWANLAVHHRWRVEGGRLSA